MTTIVVYEQISATMAEGDFGSASASLLREGRAMLEAVLADLASLPDVTARAALSERELLQLSADADHTLLIAPEFEGILLNLATRVREEGGTLLGPSPAAIRLTSDKLRLGRYWEDHGVRTPATREFKGRVAVGTMVVKPRDGAGSQATRLLHPGDRLDEAWPGPMIAQEYVPGLPASVSILCGPAGMLPLHPCEQRLSNDGRFSYLGGRSITDPKLANRAQAIALRAASSVSGLLGYVGVDVILGDDGRDWAIEINPRLTSSYVGLRRMTDTNLMGAVLAIARGELVTIKWKTEECEFAPGES